MSELSPAQVKWLSLNPEFSLTVGAPDLDRSAWLTVDGALTVGDGGRGEVSVTIARDAYYHDDRLPVAVDESRRSRLTAGTVYLLHFSRPLSHARHYLGFAQDLPARLRKHNEGLGAKLTRAAHAAGITFQLVATWPGDRVTERTLKARKCVPRICPICRPEALQKRNARERAARRRKECPAVGQTTVTYAVSE